MAGQWTIFDSADALASLKRSQRLRGLLVRLQALQPTATIERLKLVAELRRELGNSDGIGYSMEPIKPAENEAVPTYKRAYEIAVGDTINAGTTTESVVREIFADGPLIVFRVQYAADGLPGRESFRSDGLVLVSVADGASAPAPPALVDLVPAEYVNPYPADAKLSVFGARKSAHGEIYMACPRAFDAYGPMKVRNMRRAGQPDVYPVTRNADAIAAALSVPGLPIIKRDGRFVAYWQMLADEQAAKDAEVAAKEAQGGSVEPIREAVAPMLEAALARAEQSVRSYADHIVHKVASAGGDFLAVFPHGGARDSREAYRAKENARNQASRLFVADDERMVGLGIRRYSHGAPEYVKPHPPGVDSLIVSARAQVTANYEAYIAKLNAKIGPVLEASAVGSDAWSSSMLTVKTVTGDIERWSTQVIINRSGLGTLFNQWPTRKLA